MLSLSVDAWRLTFVACALLASLAALGYGRTGRAVLAHVARVALAAAAGCAVMALWVRRLELNHLPGCLPGEYGLVVAACALLGTCALLAGLRTRDRRTLPTLVLASTALAVVGAWSYARIGALPWNLVPSMRSDWFPVHVVSWALALSFASTASFASVFPAIASRALASLPEARPGRITTGCSNLAFVAATIGLASGSTWSLQAWGKPIHWDAKELMALGAWLLLLVHCTRAAQPRGQRTSLFLHAAHAVLWISILGLGYMPGSMRSLHTFRSDARRAWVPEERFDDGGRSLPRRALATGVPQAFSARPR